MSSYVINVFDSVVDLAGLRQIMPSAVFCQLACVNLMREVLDILGRPRRKLKEIKGASSRADGQHRHDRYIAALRI